MKKSNAIKLKDIDKIIMSKALLKKVYRLSKENSIKLLLKNGKHITLVF